MNINRSGKIGQSLYCVLNTSQSFLTSIGKNAKKKKKKLCKTLNIFRLKVSLLPPSPALEKSCYRNDNLVYIKYNFERVIHNYLNFLPSLLISFFYIIIYNH